MAGYNVTEMPLPDKRQVTVIRISRRTLARARNSFGICGNIDIEIF